MPSFESRRAGCADPRRLTHASAASCGCRQGPLVRLARGVEGDELPETMIVVSVEASEAGSNLELEHYGFGAGPDWDELYVSAARGWAGYLKNLRAVL